MATHSVILAARNPINSTKSHKYMTLEDALPRWEGVQYATGKDGRQSLNTPERIK